LPNVVVDTAVVDVDLPCQANVTGVSPAKVSLTNGGAFTGTLATSVAFTVELSPGCTGAITSVTLQGGTLVNSGGGVWSTQVGDVFSVSSTSPNAVQEVRPVVSLGTGPIAVVGNTLTLSAACQIGQPGGPSKPWIRSDLTLRKDIDISVGARENVANGCSSISVVFTPQPTRLSSNIAPVPLGSAAGTWSAPRDITLSGRVDRKVGPNDTLWVSSSTVPYRILAGANELLRGGNVDTTDGGDPDGFTS
jgi:hypothetical protein